MWKLAQEESMRDYRTGIFPPSVIQSLLEGGRDYDCLSSMGSGVINVVKECSIHRNVQGASVSQQPGGA